MTVGEATDKFPAEAGGRSAAQARTRLRQGFVGQAAYATLGSQLPTLAQEANQEIATSLPQKWLIRFPRQASPPAKCQEF